MSGEVDLVEVVHTGTGGSLVSKRRFWLNDELLEVERCEPGRRFYGDGVCVVESFFENRRSELEYWDPASGSVLTQTAVGIGPDSVWWSVDRRMLDAYAPDDGVLDATFFARFRLLGLALDPTAVFKVDVRLEDGFPVGERTVTRAPASVEVEITGTADEVLSWCTGQKTFVDLPSMSLQTGSPFILGVVAGTLAMSGGFTIPAELTNAAQVLVGLVESHRRVLRGRGAPL